MNGQAVLESERIKACDWSLDGGSMEYDISHIHPDLDVLIQSYTVETTDYAGRRIFGSEFLIFKKGQQEPSILTDYPKETKVEIWKTVFAVKMRFFTEVRPDIVLHFIKQPHSVEQRYSIYSKYFTPPNYTIDKSKFDIVYTKTTSTGNGGGPFFSPSIAEVD